jgi:phenylacetate-CoA ligase
MAEKKYWNKKFMTMTPEATEKVQIAKLRKQLRYECDRSPYYKERIQGAGVIPEKLESLEELTRIPRFTKEDHRLTQEESMKHFGHPYGVHVCARTDEIVQVNATSGTTGMPTFYAFTKRDLVTNAECTARALWVAGVRPGDTVLLAFALSMFVGGIPLAIAIQYLGAKVVPVGAEGGTRRLLEFANLTRPTHMILTPSFAEYLAEKSPEILGKEIDALGVRTLLCGGEAGAGDPAVRAKLSQAYGGASVYDMMGGAYGFMAVSCDYHNGMHIVTPDHEYQELVNAETKEPIKIEDGAVGTLLHTSLDWEGTPCLRYDLGDVTQIYTSPCPCGITGLRQKVLGRADDMLIVKGINVYPAAIKNVVTEFFPRTSGELRVVLDEPGPKVPAPLLIRVEYGKAEKDLPGLGKEIEQKLSDLLRFKAAIELIPDGTLDRSSTKTKLIEKRYETKAGGAG